MTNQKVGTDSSKHEVTLVGVLRAHPKGLGVGHMCGKDVLAGMPYKAWEMCRQVVAIETIQLDEGLVS